MTDERVSHLSRRDALVVLGTLGAAVGGGFTALKWNNLKGNDGSGTTVTEHEAETLIAVARIVFPTKVTGIPKFVETYTVGRLRNRPTYADNLKEALDTLDGYAEDWFEARYASLSSESQTRLLRELGIERSDPDPEGNDAERLRYYLVNELLYALYSSPTGGKLVGIENPQGHPGGLATYQRGPEHVG